MRPLFFTTSKIPYDIDENGVIVVRRKHIDVSTMYTGVELKLPLGDINKEGFDVKVDVGLFLDSVDVYVVNSVYHNGKIRIQLNISMLLDGLVPEEPVFKIKLFPICRVKQVKKIKNVKIV